MSSLADRILVIDHQKEDRLRLSDYLIAKGYMVQTVSTIQQANLLMEDDSPDLIFADISNEEIKTLPFIERDTFPASLVIVSETKLAGDVVACLRAGAADFILKPVEDYSSVDHVIHRILDKIRLAKLNRRLHKELEEGNKKLSAGIQELRADQKAGLQVQLKMLPDTYKNIHGYCFDHRIKPSLYLSGDFLDYFKLDQDRSLLYFADLSGPGETSASVTYF